GGGQDRMYRVSSFQILGPFGASGLGPTPSRERIFSCHSFNDACPKQIITSLAKRAYRRPVSDHDLTELLAYYQDGVKDGGFENGIRSGITGILASPFFLYRGERVPAGVRAGLRRVPVCVGPRRSARGFQNGTHAFCRQHLQGRSQRRRSAESEPHLS